MPSERAEKDEPCEHGIRWPWACDDCDRAEWADHQAQLAATPPPASADALGEVERVARALAKSNHEDPDAPLTKLADSDITHAWQLYIDDATAALSAMSQAGWIVGNADGTQWRTWEDGLPLWTGNIDHACRYARRIDAESAHQEDEDAWRIVPYTKGPRHD